MEKTTTIDNAVILLTGGTGTFGRAFTRRALELGAQKIRIFSRGEHAQAEMREEFEDDQRLRWFIGDVRDRDRLKKAMRGAYIVVHAAALKRVEVGYYNPTEMVRTNIEGTINVVETACSSALNLQALYISSDKAFQPVSPYGYSKAMGESIVAAAIEATTRRTPKFGMVRYGNIAGSNGSVIPKWRKIIASGSGTVPVTDPDCTRFWMTIDQAVDLVINTLDRENFGHEPYPIIPELPAYKLGDLAKAMRVDTKIIGLPPYEKKHESMAEGVCSNNVERLSVMDLKEKLEMLP